MKYIPLSKPKKKNSQTKIYEIKNVGQFIMKQIHPLHKLPRRFVRSSDFFVKNISRFREEREFAEDFFNFAGGKYYPPKSKAYFSIVRLECSKFAQTLYRKGF